MGCGSTAAFCCCPKTLESSNVSWAARTAPYRGAAASPDVSTDEISRLDLLLLRRETREYPYLGLKWVTQRVTPGSVKAAGFAVTVAASATARLIARGQPFAQRCAGIRLVIARASSASTAKLPQPRHLHLDRLWLIERIRGGKASRSKS